MRKHLAVLAVLALAACKPEPPMATELATSELQSLVTSNDGADVPGAVFTLTNQVGNNAVAVFRRDAGGALVASGMFPTGGSGTGAGLGSEGAVVLTGDGRLLLAVNAGSNDVSVFRVESSNLVLAGRTASGGESPISIAVHKNLVYVLNGGGPGNITGFTLEDDGMLTPLAGSTRSLSGANTGPAQVQFSPDGRTLVVTEKATNLVDLFAVDATGLAGELTSVPSAGGTPFGFDFGRQNVLFVSEAAGSASSYILGSQALSLASGAVATHQAAPCWAIVTRDGRFGYTGNTGGGTISAFAIGSDGTIRLLDSDGATAAVGGPAIDLTVSANSRFLYQLVGGDAPAIHGFRIRADGSLETLGVVGELPAGTLGLAAL
jgi:6-phosphogluconolactonase